MRKRESLHDIWERTPNRHLLVFQSLCLGFLGGCVGVLVDFDHFLYFAGFQGVGLAGRPLHVPMAVLAGCLGIYSCACLGGLVNKLVLKRIFAFSLKALLFLAFVAVLVGLEILWIVWMDGI